MLVGTEEKKKKKEYHHHTSGSLSLYIPANKKKCRTNIKENGELLSFFFTCILE